MLNIAIDAHMVGERETGNETYTLSLIRALLAMPPAADMRFLLYTTHTQRLRDRLQAQPGAAIRRVRPAPAMLRIPFGLPVATGRDGANLLHVNYVAPPWGTCPHVVTVHDISYVRYPQFFSPRDRWMLTTMVPFTMRRAARVITVSQHARQEIIDCYGLAPQRVVVTYEAAGEQFQPVLDPAVLAAVRVRYGLPAPAAASYLLALGNLQPRKNIARLVEAYARLRGQGELPDVHLAIAGKAQWRESEVYGAVARAGLAGQVHFLGYVDDADLPALYSDALALVYPSLYEGFGLPPLEAMACGTPVITSNVASLPEVVGEAALTISPTDVEALAAAIRRMATDASLRAHYVLQGRRRAADFTWQRCAEETLDVYRAAVRAH